MMNFGLVAHKYEEIEYKLDYKKYYYYLTPEVGLIECYSESPLEIHKEFYPENIQSFNYISHC